MTVRQQLATTVQALLRIPATDANDNVYLWRDWALDPAKLPAIVIRVRRADRNDITRGHGIPNFLATVWLEIDCIAQDQMHLRAEAEAEALGEAQVLPAVTGLIVGPPQTFRRISRIESEIEVSAEGKTHVATASYRFALEYEEQYAPLLTTVLQQIEIVALKPDATEAQIAAIQAALNAGEADSVLAALPGVMAGADIAIPSA